MIRFVALGCLLLTLTGCQTLHPFAQRTKERIQSARDWANGGLEAFQCGRLQQAKGFFAKATEQSPDDFRVRANLARTLHQSGESAEAIAQMELAVGQSGGDPSMLIELGQMYLDVEQLAPASRQVRAALKVDRRYAPAWQLQGRVERARGNLANALANFQKAAGYAPDQLTIQMDIAETYQLNDQPYKAFATIEDVLAKHPIDSQPESLIVAKADVLTELGRPGTAVATLKQAVRNQPDSSVILTRLAKAQIDAGLWSDARSTIAQARATFPGLTRLDGLENTINQRQDDQPQRVAHLGGL